MSHKKGKKIKQKEYVFTLTQVVELTEHNQDITGSLFFVRRLVGEVFVLFYSM